MKKKHWSERVTQEESEKLIGDAMVVCRYLQGAIPRRSYFSVIMGIMDFIEGEKHENNEEESRCFGPVQDSLNEALNIMTDRW